MIAQPVNILVNKSNSRAYFKTVNYRICKLYLSKAVIRKWEIPKYILFLLAQRGRRGEIAKEEDQCKKSKGVITLKSAECLPVCHLRIRILEGLEHCYFCISWPGWWLCCFFLCSYLLYLQSCVLCTFLYVPLSISLSGTTFHPVTLKSKCWSHLDSSLYLHLISNLPRHLVGAHSSRLHLESDPSSPPGLRHLLSLTWTIAVAFWSPFHPWPAYRVFSYSNQFLVFSFDLKVLMKY